MDQVDGMRVFVRVAQRASFAAAARELRVSPAAVTKQIAALEGRVGVRLLDRTTRSVAMTEAGRVYLERCLECLQAFEDADASVSELSSAPRGRLRISAPFDLQSLVSRILASFACAYPDVRIDLELSNRAVDLVDEGFDVAIRAAANLDGRYVARPLCEFPLGVFASPHYLRTHGRPRRPADLVRHRALLFVEPRLWSTLDLVREKRRVRVELTPALTANSGDALREMGIAGLGILPAPTLLMRDALAAGLLERILDDWEPLPRPKLWAIYPHRRFVPAKVRLVVDALRDGLSTRD